MKFLIRDDDVNYFYSPDYLEERYKDIYEICPISACIVPYVKGDYFKWVTIAENNKEEAERRMDEFFDDDEIHPVDSNKELVTWLRNQHAEGKVGISMHGIYHRNWDRYAKPIAGNYISGAEMWTNEDRTGDLRKAKEYLENVFGFSVNTFTAPQNMISVKSFESISKAGFNLNADVWPLKDMFNCLSIYGVKNFLSFFCDKIKSSRMIYPKEFHVGDMKVTAVTRFYPSHRLDDIKKNFDYAYKNDGVFVLGTHSYAYDTKMSYYNMTLKEGIIEILNYTQKFENVEYLTFEELYK